MTLQIRKAEPEDAESIQQLYSQLVSDANVCVSPDQLAALKHDGYNHVFVALSNAKMVATAFLTICRDVMYGDQPFAVLENIVVDRDSRRQGAGFELMDFIKSFSKENRCTKIMLLSSSKRTEAHSFFEKCGYQGDLKRAFVNYVNRG